MKAAVFILFATVAAGQPSGDGRALLDEVAAATRALKSWKVAGTLALDVEIGGRKTRTESTFTIAKAWPNLMRADVVADPLATSTVCDGEMLWVTNSNPRRHHGTIQLNAPLCSPASPWPDLPPAGVSASLRGTAAVEIAGTPVACQIVEVPLSNFSLPVNLNGTVRIYHVTEGTRTLCIDRTRHSVLRDEFHQVLAAGETARAAVNVSGTFTYTSFERDLDLSRELFRFQPPAGSVDDHKLAPAQPGALLFGPLLASGPPVFRIGGGVSVPRTIHKVKPRYDKEARRKHIQGTVVLLCVIDPDGLPRNFQIVRSLDPGLDQEAIKAVSAWRFEPGRKDGQPVAVIAAVEVNFRLLDDPPL